MRRVIRKPNVIAGLKWPPEMCPSAETMIAIVTPWATATPIRDGSWIAAAVTIEPAPMNVSANAPTNSATARRSVSSAAMTPNVCARPDGPRGAHTLLADASPGDVQPQPDAVALADVPLLLQVLLVRHALRAPVRAGGGARDPRRRGAPAREGAAGADRRAPGGERRGARAPALLRPRGLHRLRGVGVRTGAGARPLAAHQPRGAGARGAGAPARGHGLAGADARVDLRAADGHGPRGLAEQAPDATAGHDPRGG